jgi:hypothetical protein
MSLTLSSLCPPRWNVADAPFSPVFVDPLPHFLAHGINGVASRHQLVELTVCHPSEWKFLNITHDCPSINAVAMSLNNVARSASLVVDCALGVEPPRYDLIGGR